MNAAQFHADIKEEQEGGKGGGKGRTVLPCVVREVGRGLGRYIKITWLFWLLEDEEDAVVRGR